MVLFPVEDKLYKKKKQQKRAISLPITRLPQPVRQKRKSQDMNAYATYKCIQPRDHNFITTCVCSPSTRGMKMSLNVYIADAMVVPVVIDSYYL
ncbi:hypothetical protein C5167_016747 [Papaver somniferum]|nr:hypothetical protein C5167_016747 [Papaver somniferum]